MRISSDVIMIKLDDDTLQGVHLTIIKRCRLLLIILDNKENMLKISRAYKPYRTVWLYNPVPHWSATLFTQVICPSCDAISILYHLENDIL
jgi:hypothetical protein